MNTFLTFNCGSSSLSCKLFRAESHDHVEVVLSAVELHGKILKVSFPSAVDNDMFSLLLNLEEG